MRGVAGSKRKPLLVEPVDGVGGVGDGELDEVLAVGAVGDPLDVVEVRLDAVVDAVPGLDAGARPPTCGRRSRTGSRRCGRPSRRAAPARRARPASIAAGMPALPAPTTTMSRRSRSRPSPACLRRAEPTPSRRPSTTPGVIIIPEQNDWPVVAAAPMTSPTAYSPSIDRAVGAAGAQLAVDVDADERHEGDAVVAHRVERRPARSARAGACARSRGRRPARPCSL